MSSRIKKSRLTVLRASSPLIASPAPTRRVTVWDRCELMVFDDSVEELVQDCQLRIGLTSMVPLHESRSGTWTVTVDFVPDPTYEEIAARKKNPEVLAVLDAVVNAYARVRDEDASEEATPASIEEARAACSKARDEALAKLSLVPGSLRLQRLDPDGKNSP